MPNLELHSNNNFTHSLGCSAVNMEAHINNNKINNNTININIGNMNTNTLKLDNKFIRSLFLWRPLYLYSNNSTRTVLQVSST